jgi:hypothetical protein
MDSNPSSRLVKLQGPLTIEEFSKKLGVPYTTLHSYIAGKKGRKPSVPPASFLEKVVKKTRVSAHWLLTGEGAMLREEEGKNVSTDILQDPNLFDIVGILKDDPDAKKAVYECLVGVKHVERVAKILKGLLIKKVEGHLQEDVKEDPMLLDIIKILRKNPKTKQMIYSLLEQDVNLERALKLLLSHAGDKIMSFQIPPEERLAGNPKIVN